MPSVPDVRVLVLLQRSMVFIERFWRDYLRHERQRRTMAGDAVTPYLEGVLDIMNDATVTRG